jgi:hypothetical protein
VNKFSSISDLLSFIAYEHRIKISVYPKIFSVFGWENANLLLSPGRYRVGARITTGGEEADWPRNGVGYLDVESGDFFRSGSEGFRGPTPFLVNGTWDVRNT